MSNSRILAIVACCLISGGAFAEECGSPRVDGQCLSTEINAADAYLNYAFSELIRLLDEPGQRQLRQTQRAWIDERNDICRIGARETWNEKWRTEILADPTKTKCIIRYSKARTIELNDLIARRLAKSPSIGKSFEENMLIARNSHATGKWYFEVKANVGEIAKTVASTLRTLCIDPESNDSHGHTLEIDAGRHVGEILIGVAVDLDAGKLYQSVGGNWHHGKPGSSGGLNLKLGRAWQCGLQSSQPVASFVSRLYLDVNFGERPFIHLPPAGYLPYRGKPVLLLAGTTELGNSPVRIFFDYLSFDIQKTKPTLAMREEYTELRPLIGLPKKYRSTLINLEVDCTKSAFKPGSSFYMSDGGTYIGTFSDQVKIDLSGSPNDVGGALIHTLCFLKEKGFELPNIDASDSWEPMVSPDKAIKISEATMRRQYRDSYLLVKISNQLTAAANLADMKSRSFVGISAFNCRSHVMNNILTVAFNEDNQAISASYFDNENRAPRLPANRQRFINACEAISSTGHPVQDEPANCNIQSVPESAIRQPQLGGTGVTLHYPDPRTVPDDYTGCLNSWMVVGEETIPAFVAKFEKGVIQSWKMAAMNIACSYEGGQLIKENSNNAPMCPPAHDVALKKWQR